MKRNHLTILLVFVTSFAIEQTAPGRVKALSLTTSDQLPAVQDEQNQQKWRKDLKTLVKGLRNRHANLFHSVPEAEFEAEVASLDARIATLTNNQINLEFVRLVALISRTGRDAHTQYIPSPLNLLPLQLYVFSDGVFVIDARQPHEGLVGRRVIGIGEHSIEEVMAALTPYIGKDNDSTVRWQIPTFLLVTDLIESLGIIADQQQAQLRLQDSSGHQETVTISPITVPEYLAWREFPAIKLPQTQNELYLSDSYDPFWFIFLADSGTLYIRYNQILRKNAAGLKLAKFVKKIKAELREKPIHRVVIDLRQNNGGDNTTYGPLLAALREYAAINQPGKLFAIINRGVFSAATNFVTDLERQTNVVLVGEPTGGSPNHYGDAVQLLLPNFGGTLLVSTAYHQRSDPNDARLAVEPDIAVELSASDYFAGRDAALAAILEFAAQPRKGM